MSGVQSSGTFSYNLQPGAQYSGAVSGAQYSGAILQNPVNHLNISTAPPIGVREDVQPLLASGAQNIGAYQDGTGLQQSVTADALKVGPVWNAMRSQGNVTIPMEKQFNPLRTQSILVNTGGLLQPSSCNNTPCQVAEACMKEALPCEISPLGFHLSSSVKEKIWRGEFVDLLSLLPSSKEFLSKLDKKSEERSEEDRRRAVPRTFQNWLQAFCIFASVMGEKFPEKCSGLFQHLDIVAEAFRHFGGISWFHYDENFRQKLAVHPSLRWGVKDVGLWLNLMLPPKPQVQFKAPNSTNNSFRKGFCFAFNEGQCGFLANLYRGSPEFSSLAAPFENNMVVQYTIPQNEMDHSLSSFLSSGSSFDLSLVLGHHYNYITSTSAATAGSLRLFPVILFQYIDKVHLRPTLRPSFSQARFNISIICGICDFRVVISARDADADLVAVFLPSNIASSLTNLMSSGYFNDMTSAEVFSWI
ncbi:uncharacterized protein LOC143925697 [Lithobates pipiens]